MAREFWRALSVALFALLGAFMIWFGWTYLTVAEPLWFHAAAVPETAREAVRPLYFALMNLIGGASIGLGVLALHATLAGVLHRRLGTAATLAGVFALVFVVAAITAEELARQTGSPTSWHIMGGLLAVDAAAFVAALLSGRPKAAA